MAATQEDSTAEASSAPAGVRLHGLTPDVALLVWEDSSDDRPEKRPRVCVGGRPATQTYCVASVRLAASRRRNIIALHADAAAIGNERISIANADGAVVAIADTPNERSAAFTPAELIAGVNAAGRVRITRLMLEVIPGIFRLANSPALANAGLSLLAALAPTPPALLPCSGLSGSYRLFACAVDAALAGNPGGHGGHNLSAVVVGGGRVARAPFAPALTLDRRDAASGRLFLALRDPEAGHPGTRVVIFSEHGMICRRIATRDRPLPPARAWFQASGSAKAEPSGRRYVLDCLAHLGKQDAQAAALLRELQALGSFHRVGRAPGPVAAAAGLCEVIDIGTVPRWPDVAVIGPAPQDPLLMRCRTGLYAADPAMRAAEVVYVLRGAENQREIAHFLRDLHAAYGIAARLVVVAPAAVAAAALNAGIAVSRAPVLVSLGPRVLPQRAAWLGALTRQLTREANVGIVAASLRGEDGAAPVGSVAGVSPDCIAMSRSVLAECGGFPEHYLSLAYSVADLCLTAAAAGFKTCLTSEATVFRLDPFEDQDRRREAARAGAETDRRLLEQGWRARLEHGAAARDRKWAQCGWAP
jgi:hypothetical protein